MNTDQIRSWHAQGMSRAHDVPHLCDEIERLRAELTVAQKRNSELLPIAAECARAVCHEHAVSRLERAEAAIARVRELCRPSGTTRFIRDREIRAAIEGEQA